METLRTKETQPTPIPSFGVILIFHDLTILVIHRGQAKNKSGMFGIPAGTQLARESKKQTAAREMFEETGVVINPDTLQAFPDNSATAVIDRKDGPKKFSLEVFLCTELPPDTVLHASSETGAHLTPVNMIAPLEQAGMLLPNTLKLIQRGYAYSKKHG